MEEDGTLLIVIRNFEFIGVCHEFIYVPIVPQNLSVRTDPLMQDETASQGLRIDNQML